MGVYSELKPEEQKYIEDIYQIKIKKISFINTGILNSNFLLHTENTEKNTYVLRVFEADRTLEEEIQELDLLEKISDVIPVPKLIKNKENLCITKFNNKKIALFEYIEGEILLSSNINQAIMREIAWYLGKLHKFSENFEIKNFNRSSRINLDFYLDEIKKSGIEFEEKEKIFSLAEELKQINFNHLPKGIIHSDIFPDNIIIKDGHIAGILDFNEACYAPFIFDLAIIINFWIKSKKYISFQKENDMIRDFLNNYSRHRKIEKEEIKLLNWACKKMALTFMCLRIYKEKIEKRFEKAIDIENKSYLLIINLLEKL